nr:hypothetical protein Iba_chr03aCG7540 [Ipomoea batatas]
MIDLRVAAEHTRERERPDSKPAAACPWTIGAKPPRKPKKRPRAIQQEIDIIKSLNGIFFCCMTGKVVNLILLSAMDKVEIAIEDNDDEYVDLSSLKIGIAKSILSLPGFLMPLFHPFIYNLLNLILQN